MMNLRPIALSLTATLALTGFTACSAPGQTPVAVSDPVSASSSSAPDPVSAALDACDYAYHDYTQEWIEERSGPTAEAENPDGTPYSKTFEAPDAACMNAQQAANLGAKLMEPAHGVDLTPYELTVYSFRTSQYQNNERYIWVVDSWEAPDNTDESSFHFRVELDAITGQLLKMSGHPFVYSDPTETSETAKNEFIRQLPTLFETIDLPAVEQVEEKTNEYGARQFWVTTASGNYWVSCYGTESEFHISYLVLDGAYS